MTGPNGGGAEPAHEMFSEMYDELRRLAHARLRRNEPVTLLDTTSLVHETFLRVLKSGSVGESERPQFLAYAARVMRSIIVDFVRQRHAERRGGDDQRIPLDALGEEVPSAEDEVLRVSQALDELAKADERLVRIVEMRYFGGYTEEDIALALGVNERTVRREWQKARLLLALALQ
ncbi:MAG: sigma-70 family RNA polymerase sigma factor [Acidobacteriota bacterium]|nr:sigma-70 family RNA polymerase sigma factor [Acidobacteriota bacterium]